MNEITQFRCILPPVGGSVSPFEGGTTPEGGARSGPIAGPAGIIARALDPLRDRLNAALLRGDQPGALTLAYTALSRVADALAAWRDDTPQAEEVCVHALLVELETLPLEPLPDGTMIEHGTAVTVNYSCWTVQQRVAALWAQTLAERFQALWPGAWIVVGAHE
jgi:hypothetical protein